MHGHLVRLATVYTSGKMAMHATKLKRLSRRLLSLGEPGADEVMSGEQKRRILDAAGERITIEVVFWLVDSCMLTKTLSMGICLKMTYGKSA